MHRTKILIMLEVVFIVFVVVAYASAPGERWSGTTKGKGGPGCSDFNFKIVTNEGKITGWAYTPSGSTSIPEISWEVSGSVSPNGSVYIRAVATDLRAGQPNAVWTGQMSGDTIEISQPSSINCYIEPRKGTLTRISALEKPELRDKNLPGSFPTTILKEIPAAYTIPYGDIVYVENDGRCSQGEVIKITGGHGGRGIPRKYECVKRPLVQAQPPSFDFSGIWSGRGYSCVDPQPPQYVVIKIEDGDVTATKLTGDSCIRAGEVTWRGKYTGNPFPGQMSGRRPELFWFDVSIRIVDENTINVSGAIFTRVEVPSPSWVLQRKVPMSEWTLERLTKIAESISTEDRKVSPMQVAAQLFEESLRRPLTEEDWLPIDTPKVDTPKVDTTVDASVYDDYVGQYAYAIVTVTREGDRLFAQLRGQRKFEIFPKSETEFFWKVVDAQVTFVKNEAGVVVKAIHRQHGEFEAPKIK